VADKSTRWTTKHAPMPGLHEPFAKGSGQAEAERDEPAEEPMTGPAPGPQPRPMREYPPDLVFIVSAEGTILFLNRELPGVPQQEVLGTSLYRYLFPEQHDEVRQCLAAVFSTGEAGGFECAGMRPHDATSWYQCRVAPNERGGRVVSATIIGRDITQRKQIEDQLREEREELRRRLEERAAEVDAARREAQGWAAAQGENDQTLVRFRQLVDQAGEAIFVTEPGTGRFVDVNETACRWLGREREQILELTVADVDVRFPLQSPEPSAEHVPDTRDKRRPQIFDHGVHRRRDGSTFPVEVAVARRRFGDREFVLAVAREINSRKRTESALIEAENKYRALLELTRDAVYLSARDGTIAEANDAAMALFGYTRQELVGLEAKRLYRQPDDIRRFQDGVAERGAVHDLPVTLLARDGSPIRALLSATLRRGGGGSVLGYQCIVRRAADAADAAPRETGGERPGNGHRLVLVAGADPRFREHVVAVLARAGLELATADDDRAAAGLIERRAADLGAVVASPDAVVEAPWPSLAALRGRRPGLPVLLVGDQPEAEIRAALADGPFARAPITAPFPLALAQRVRDALGPSA